MLSNLYLKLFFFSTFTFIHLAGALTKEIYTAFKVQLVLRVYLNMFLAIYSEYDYDLKRISSDTRMSK